MAVNTFNRKRAMHSLVIARIMADISGRFDMFCLGLIHEVGYRFTDIEAFEYGARLIERNGLPFGNEIRNTLNLDSTYTSYALDLLNFASLLVSNDGIPCGYEIKRVQCSKTERERYDRLMEALMKKGFRTPEHLERFQELPYFANDRMLHDVMVGNVLYTLKEEEDLFLLGLLHDIGKYKSNHEHAIDGGELLKTLGYKYWREVYYHESVPDPVYESQELDLLRVGDLSVDAKGIVVGYDARIEDLATRYAADDFLFSVLCDNKGYLEAKDLYCPEALVGSQLE